ncbi:podocan [Diabrotica undecimpunctata]|uniref:podocan n=1 Tax=Diabrotica undecimpunctata TaxID=50387 RepID=UPI003B638613
MRMRRWWCLFGIIPVVEIVLGMVRMSERCPDVCICANHVTDCQRADLTDLPNGIDPDVMSLDMSINSLEKIPLGLKYYPHLEYVNMSHNWIAILGHQDFNGLSNLTTLDLSFNNFLDWRDIQSQTFVNLKKLESMNFSSNPLRVLSISHFNLQPLKSLLLNNCSIELIPKGFVKGIPNLEELYLAHNPIGSLRVNMSSKTLKLFDLSNCHLSRISEYAFTYLETLETLYLNRNRFLRNITINSDTLLYLDLSDSFLESVPHGSMRELRSLNLYGNMLRELRNNKFINTPNLVTLNLSLNAITSIDRNAFRGLEYVKVIDLSFNKLNIIPVGAFFSTKSLIRLNVSHNYLSSIDNLNSMSLNGLDASYCEISTVSQDSLSRLPKLSYLSLKRNFITTLPDNWSAQYLRSLDLSDCRIKTINNKTFSQMSSLQEIDLSSNRLTTVHYTNFPRNILVISITDNLWRCDCLVLKDTYEWLQLHGSFVDELICDSPESVDGQNWLMACQSQWYPSSEKKDHLWWYSIALLISMLVLLLTIVALRKINEAREKRYQEIEQRRLQQERETREARERMLQMQREYREETNQNAPDPRESQGPPSYTDALLLPRLDSSHPSLAGSYHSFGSRGSLHGSNPEVNKKGKIRRKKRRRRSESERPSVRQVSEESNESEGGQREPPLESDF